MNLLEIYDVERSHMIDVLKKDCAEYIKVLQQTRGTALLRGSKASYAKPGTLNIIQPRASRMPKDTDAAIHFYINHKLERKFGYKFRNGVFAISDFDLAYHYGNVSIVFPIGPLQFLWSPQILDLYTYLQDEMDFDGSIHGDEFNERLDKIVDLYQKTDLATAIKTHREVMLANKCYMVSLEDYKAIEKELLS